MFVNCVWCVCVSVHVVYIGIMFCLFVVCKNSFLCSFDVLEYEPVVFVLHVCMCACVCCVCTHVH